MRQLFKKSKTRVFQDYLENSDYMLERVNQFTSTLGVNHSVDNKLVVDGSKKAILVISVTYEVIQ